VEVWVVATGGALVVVGRVTGGRTAGAALGCGAWTGVRVAVGAGTGAAVVVRCCGTVATGLPELGLLEGETAEVVGVATGAALGAGAEGVAPVVGVAPLEGTGATGTAGWFCCWTEPDCPLVLDVEESVACAACAIAVVKTNVAANPADAEPQVRRDSRLTCESRTASRWPGLLMVTSRQSRMLRRR
jgi:hypothetical protein